ncbi:TetR/AcrR family transcriptional regulator [Alkalibacter rhizosphaerae]|uniref:TetR/AcrR family transcriptional regulator n=1 Tax=Alkalibacter rhizosphaerae TaxID=2815577 RepID=A0A974XGA3_9FIRM|nr:TetR/AcrR family transcriptional regulator [Alkalibacter rhizosphaerae]QSX09221.1 TetR/AcrR family transcriptional regulator [Alkalibacter rhizosphaerae]
MRKEKNMYKKGITTKNNILKASKELFYENGYNNTTVHMIKDRAEVSLSAIPYYFKEKDRILQVIYTDFLSSIYKLVQKHMKEPIDSYLLHFLASKIYYYIIHDDANNDRFYREVTFAQSNIRILYPFMDTVHHNYARDFNIQLTEGELKYYRLTDAGGRREIMMDYYNDPASYDFNELIDYITSIVPNLMGIDKEVSREYARKSTAFAKEVDYSAIKFLV